MGDLPSQPESPAPVKSLLPLLFALLGASAMAEELPTSIDLRPALAKAGVAPRQQGERGTCSVFTVTTAVEFALSRMEQPPGRLSVEYLNWASNETLGKAQDGGFFSDLWKGYQAWGICREDEMPYAANFDPERKPAATLIATSKTRAARLRMTWIKPWNIKTGLSAEELTAIRRTLANGWPVCSGLRWPKKAIWQDGVLGMCPPDEVFDGHSVLLIGCETDANRPGGGTLRFFNSNRPEVECRMTWEYAVAYMNDAMWIEPVGK